MKQLKQNVPALFLAVAMGAQYAASAVTTLYIPFLDRPQPITADIEGVDAGGHTTWRLGPGVASGTLTDDSDLFTSATLVADATSARLVENDSELDFAITADCGIGAGGLAVCTAVGSGGGMVRTDTTTATLMGFEVQLGTGTFTTGTGSASPTDPGAVTSTPTGSPTDSGAATNGTGTDGASPTARGGENGAGRVWSSMLGLGVTAMISAFFF